MIARLQPWWLRRTLRKVPTQVVLTERGAFTDGEAWRPPTWSRMPFTDGDVLSEY